MSTERTLEINSSSLEDTLALAGRIGASLKGGETIELVSDLGGGKTSFVRGLVAGAGSQDKVHSPSFTLSNQYDAAGLTIYHFDFYRLNEAGIMKDELAELLGEPNNVVVVEWAGIVEGVLPAKRVKINIVATGESERKITINFPEELKYLFPDNT